MNRTPPAEVRRKLRQEVGFGCPVSGCRQAFLTWHHFDPPWNVKQHQRPEGMIALCRKHHDAADQGVYSKGELRELKESLVNSQSVIADLPWSKREFLIRLGGCYSGGTDVAISLAGKRAVWLRRAGNGFLFLSFQLSAADGSVLAAMDDNMFEADPSRLHDLEATTSGTRLKFWLSQRNIGLNLSFERVTLDKLSAILEVDRLRGEQAFEKRFQIVKQQLPAALRDKATKLSSEPDYGWLQSLPLFQQLPEEIQETCLSEDFISTLVKVWASSHCMDDERRIPLLNLENIVLFDGSRRVEIRNGIVADGGSTISYSASFDNGGSSFNI